MVDHLQVQVSYFFGEQYPEPAWVPLLQDLLAIGTLWEPLWEVTVTSTATVTGTDTVEFMTGQDLGRLLLYQSYNKVHYIMGQEPRG